MYLKCFLIILTIASCIFCEGLIFSGSVYTDLSLLYYFVNKKDSVDYSGIGALELKLHNSNNKYAKVNAELDVYLLYGENASSWARKYQELNRLLPELQMEDAPVRLNLRELYLAIYPEFADISIGRQIINFGKGIVLSPIDIFTSVDVTDLNFKKSGSDVVNIKIPVGMLSGIDIIKEIPVSRKKHSTAVKAFTNLMGFDLDLIGIYRHKEKETIFGAALKGDIVAGVYGEVVQHLSHERNKSYIEFMAGSDYSMLNNDLLFNIEYSYNGYRNVLDSVSLQSFMKMGKSLVKKHYSFFNVNYSVNELLSLSGNILCNIQDKAAIGTLIGRYSILQNVYTTIYLRGYHKNINGFTINPPDLESALRVEVIF